MKEGGTPHGGREGPRGGVTRCGLETASFYTGPGILTAAYSDPSLQIVEEYLNDPEIYQGNVKARTGNEILKV